ncbi:MAG: ABC transporter ATP-binding protein [Planctomycetota bacterium]|jgi:putative ABC transport system ATP-binding protein|nr:ABC transporter ATP-binding protein [Planctomycetota bacterium]
MNESPSTLHPVLLAEGLSKSYRMGSGKLEVLRDVSLELHVGEVAALMGSSGSGKSTLLQLLGLMDRCDRGSVLLRGRRVDNRGAGASARIRATEIGFVFQQFQLIQELSALENVLLPRRIARGMSWFSARGEEKRKATQLLTDVGLGARLKHKPNQLSGGEQQRVAIARALISMPPVLLADEPTGNLDRKTGDEVLELLMRMARERGTAILLATHDQSIAGSCERILQLKDGRLVLPENESAVSDGKAAESNEPA